MDEEADTEAEEEERLSEEDADRSDGGRASLSRSELRWDRSRPEGSDLVADELRWADVWNAELIRMVGVV